MASHFETDEAGHAQAGLRKYSSCKSALLLSYAMLASPLGPQVIQMRTISASALAIFAFAASGAMADEISIERCTQLLQAGPSGQPIEAHS